MKTKLRLVGGLTAGLILVGGLSACGGDDADTTETETTEAGGSTETTKAGESTETTAAGATETTKK